MCVFFLRMSLIICCQGMGVVEGSVLLKHSVGGSKNWQRYQPEVTAPLLNRLSGHEDHIKKERWNVSRTKIGTPIPLSDLVKLLFPKYLVWKDQASNTRVGDSTNCASNFLDVTLPLLCIVLVQDGVFFIRSFPNHWVSNYLCQKVPNFSHWCTVKKEEIEILDRNKVVDNKNLFNIAVQDMNNQIFEGINQIRKDFSEHKAFVSSELKNSNDWLIDYYEKNSIKR